MHYICPMKKEKLSEMLDWFCCITFALVFTIPWIFPIIASIHPDHEIGTLMFELGIRNIGITFVGISLLGIVWGRGPSLHELFFNK